MPDLTGEEAQRFWMTPVQVCQLAAVGDVTDPKVKKLLNTLSDRGHVPFEKSGEAKTAPRLYSLVSAAMLRVIFDITRDGRTYKYSQPAADAVGNTLLKWVEKLPDVSAIDPNYSDARLVFAGINDDGTPRTIKWHKGDVDGGAYMAYSVYDAGYLITRILETYASFWFGDLVARGEIDPPERKQVGKDGWTFEGGED